MQVTAEGTFEYEGRCFKSLSAVARHISGTQWSGPVFFGLRKPEDLGNWYRGQHEPIVDPGLWGRVHKILSEDAHERAGATQIRGRTDALLRGLLYAAGGERMYPTFTRKNGRQYRYYVSKSKLRFGAAAKTYERIPADEVEAVAVAQIKSVLASPEAIAAVCRVIKRQGAAVDEAQVVLSR